MSRNDGGPAFPTPYTTRDGDVYSTEYEGGMTKREAFAMAAMQGRCVFTQGHGSASIARQAVADADALLAALQDSQP